MKDGKFEKIRRELDEKLAIHRDKFLSQMESLRVELKEELELNNQALLKIFDSRFSKVNSNVQNYVDHAYEELSGANADHFSMQDGTLKDHEQRLKVLETA